MKYKIKSIHTEQIDNCLCSLRLMSDSIEAYQSTLQKGEQNATIIKMWTWNNGLCVCVLYISWISLKNEANNCFWWCVIKCLTSVVSIGIVFLSFPSKQANTVWERVDSECAIWKKCNDRKIEAKQKNLNEALPYTRWFWYLCLTLTSNCINGSAIVIVYNLIWNVIEPYTKLHLAMPTQTCRTSDYHRFNRKLPPNSWLRRFHIRFNKL